MGQTTDTSFDRAATLIDQNPRTVVFVTPLLRAREIKLATAARQHGWTVILIYTQTTPFHPEHYFDAAILVADAAQMHAAAKALQPGLCHVFSGAIDEGVLRFCNDKPSAVIVDLNDVFCPSLFNYCTERFDPTRECLAKADAFCARDLQAKFAQRYDGFTLPRQVLLFPEYSWTDGPANPAALAKGAPDDVRVVSVGTFCLEKQGHYDSGYLTIARMLTEQKIHFHIYPHWFYRQDKDSAFNFSLRDDFSDFIDLEKKTEYLHIHDSKSLDDLALELPQYDFGIIAGGCENLGQKFGLVNEKYMQSCYSGRISDYLDARLPVLINKEVSFNYRILERHNIAVDLGGILEPGFRDTLLRLKNDQAQLAATETAAQRLSVRIQAPRLNRFYERILAEHAPRRDKRHVIPRQEGFLLPPSKPASRRFNALTRKIHAVPEILGCMVRPLPRIRELYRLRAGLRETQTLLAYWRDQAEHHHNDLCQARREVTRLAESQQDMKQINDQFAVTQTELSHWRHRYQDLQKDIDNIRNEMSRILESQIDINTIASQLNSAQNQISYWSQLGEKLQGELDEARLEIDRLNQSHINAELARAQLGALQAEIKIGGFSVNDLAGWLNWPEAQDHIARVNGYFTLAEMVSVLARHRFDVSKAWDVLVRKNLDQLLYDGYRNFKRTIALNYFTFPIQADDPQLLALEGMLPAEIKERYHALATQLPDDPDFQLRDQASYRYFTLLLWHYARSRDHLGLLDTLDEPAEGNPIKIRVDGKTVSQDLANSVLEYYSIAAGTDPASCRDILEIGAGYGRNGFVFLSAHPQCRYTVVDIPPALFVAQRYLSTLFPDRTVFAAREFSHYDHVREEMEKASIIFLMPHQLSLMPDRTFNLALNISSFGEMTREQTGHYIREISRTTTTAFYTKQWKKSINPFDELELTEADYQIPTHWRCAYNRECAVQAEFFEAVYQIGDGSAVSDGAETP